LNNDLNFAAIPVVAIMAFYIAYKKIFPDYDLEKFRLPAFHDLVTVIALVVMFVFINPIVEELYWRFFCELFRGQSKTWKNKLDVNVHFAMYHWVVIFYITEDLILSTLGFCAILFLGYVLAIVKERKGLITAMVIHLAVDLAGGIALWDIRSKFLPLY